MIQEEFQEKLFLMLEDIKSILKNATDFSYNDARTPEEIALSAQEQSLREERLFLEKKELDIRFEVANLSERKLEKEKQEFQEALALRNK